MGDLVSVIMPAFNSELYVSEAIQSVLDQEHQNFELLVVNDGSKDKTKQLILSFSDPRIHYFEQENAGVSAARNRALKQMKGDYFCFLDADDLMPRTSISSRLLVFSQNPALAFVSGKVIQKNSTLTVKLSEQVPTFKGFPQKEIIRLSSSCLVSITWLIKREEEVTYEFQEGWTHSEDIAFFLSISEQGQFDFTNKAVLIYRRNTSSAMTDLKGLEQGYVNYYRFVLETIEQLSEADRIYLKRRIIRIMFLSYLSNYKIFRSVRSLIKLSFI